MQFIVQKAMLEFRIETKVYLCTRDRLRFATYPNEFTSFRVSFEAILSAFESYSDARKKCRSTCKRGASRRHGSYTAKVHFHTREPSPLGVKAPL